jgi:hypothetical protein
MNRPNAELMAAYGTDLYFLEKSGAIEEAARLLAPVASIAFAGADKAHQEELVAAAEAMNAAFRELEHEKVQQIAAGFKGASVLAPELQKVAQNVGRKLAQEAPDLEKDALVGLLGQGMGMLGRGLGTLGKSLGWGATGAVGRGGLAQGVGGGLRQIGAGLRGQGVALQRGAAAAAPALAGAATAAAPAAAKGAGLLGGKPLISGLTKAKLGLGALGLGLGYAGYKGLQSARDYMMIPTAQERYGGFGLRPMGGVNEYGYPQA